jgi:multidrug efflux pump subunit AcrA (membrane-fusion protein)
VQTNAPATIRLQGQQQAFRGRVVAVLDQLIPGSTNFAVKVQIANPLLRLHSGMPVMGTIALPRSTGITIPTTAFMDDTHSSILIVGRDGIAHATSVNEIRSDGKNSIVNGVPLGARVITNGQAGITDGDHVAPVTS